MTKILPIKVAASIHTECWTYNKLCILELNEYSNILDMSELNYWENTPDTIINTVENEISNGNYIIVYLMLSVENHFVHEYVFYGFDSEKQELYTLMLDGGRFKEKTVSFDWFIAHYKNLYDYHLYKPDNIAWFGSNFFPITKVKLRNDFNDSICFVESMRRFDEELYGKKIVISNPITSREEQYRTGIECINGISLRVKEYIRDRQYIKDVILEKLSFEMRRNICKLYEHQCIVNKAMKWICHPFGREDNRYIQSHWRLCEKMEELSLLSIKFEVTGDWELIYKIDKKLENLYENVKESLSGFLDSVTDLKKKSNIEAYNDLLKRNESILAEMEHFKD